MSSPVVVAGIDVGGSKKGFHAVALRGGRDVEQFASRQAGQVARWCREIGARVVAVDAPSRWSATGRARPAERELMHEKIWCFSTPARETAERHPKDHFRWMLNGAALFGCLESTHELFRGHRTPPQRPVCFETFPHGVACALTGIIVLAKQKRTIRRALLSQAGVDTAELSNIDQVDAALCALAAHYFARGLFKTYGEASTGIIVVPRVT